MTDAVPDPRFRDQLAEVLREFDAATGAGIPDDDIADALLPLIAAEVEARVQAAANQRAMEELPQPIEGFFAPNGEQMTAVPFRARAAALAQPTAAECPTPCDDDCDAGCHEAHQPRMKREHDPDTCVTAPVPPDANGGEER